VAYFEAVVTPPFGRAFAVSLFDSRVEVRPPVMLGQPLAVRSLSPLGFSATTEWIRLRASATTLDVSGTVRLSAGTGIDLVQSLGDAFRGDIHLPNLTVEGVTFPCGVLSVGASKTPPAPLPPRPASSRKYVEAADDSQPLRLYRQPSSEAPFITLHRLRGPFLVLEELSTFGDWTRVRFEHEGIEADGWTRYTLIPSHRHPGLSGSPIISIQSDCRIPRPPPGPDVRRGFAHVRVGTPIVAAPGQTIPWATVTAAVAFFVEHRDGSEWLELLSNNRKSAWVNGGLRHAYVQREMVTFEETPGK
jgi:hypothetical protein